MFSPRAHRWLVCISLLVGHFVGTVGFPLLATPSESADASCSGGRCGCPAELKDRHACCCKTVATQLELNCCAPKTKKACCSAESPTPKMDTESPRLTWVAGVHAQKCRGETPQGSFIFEPLIPADSEIVTLSLPTTTESLRLISDTLPIHFTLPPVPPPRLG